MRDSSFPAPKPLVVRLDQIGPDGLDIDEVVTVEWLQQALGGETAFSAQKPGRLAVHLDRLDEVVHVRGRLAVELVADCSRCLDEVPLALDTRIEVALFPHDHEPTTGPEGELRGEDMGISSYDQDEIDLGAILHDEVFLELPMSPICSETCAGLCPTCGANLNLETCECERSTDERWTALRQIKLN